MEYVVLAVGAAAVGAGIYYLFRQHRHDAQQVAFYNMPAHGRQPQAGFQRAREESGEVLVPVDFGNCRVSQSV